MGLGEDFLFELGLLGTGSMNLFPINGSFSEKIAKLIGKLWHVQLSELRTILSPFSPNMYLLHPNVPERLGQFTEEMAAAHNLLSEPCVTIQIQTCDDSATMARPALRPHHLRQRKKNDQACQVFWDGILYFPFNFFS
jgi:hypothetical protein